MYYILENRYQLRGWDRLPYAVVDRPAGEAHFVDPEVMRVLELCNGKIDFSLPLISQQTREIAAVLLQQGVIRECQSGEELSDAQAYKLYPNRFMDTVHWSVTGRCNCKCKHCYMSAPDAKYGELPHDQVMRIIEEMGASGVLKCSITGGEALVRSDFWDLIDALLAQEIKITEIYTNGFLVNDQLLDGLEKRRIHPIINMSFDGIGYHDWLRGIDGAEQRTRRAFELCQSRGFKTAAEMCLWKENANVLRDSINYLASVGCSGLKTNPIADTGAWSEGQWGPEHALSDEELLSLYLNYLDDFYQDLPRMGIHLGGFFVANGKHPDEYHIPSIHVYPNPGRASLCVHARNNMYISAEGRAMTCMGLDSVSKSFQDEYPLVQETGFQQCLTDSKYLELINTRAEDIIAHNEKCRDCEHRDLCLGGCRASAMLYHPNDMFAPDELCCQIYRGGWIQKIQEKVAQYRPDAVCVELELLRQMNESRGQVP